MPTFDLIREPWLPLYEDGSRCEVSLLDALTHADRFDGLSLDQPLQAAAIFRQVLLAVLIDVMGVPRNEREWAQRWRKGGIDADAIAAYLDEHRCRFDLFDPVQPFCQVADLRTANDATSSISVILPSLATGNNVPLFGNRCDGDSPALSPAGAARALIAAQGFDTAGIKTGAVGDENVSKGKTYGNPKGPLGLLGIVVPLGRSLAETLLLNMPIIPQGLPLEDRPQWRAEPMTARWEERPAVGPLDLLTFQSRRMRLVPEQRSDGSVFVSRAVLCAGDRLSVVPLDYEPHTGWQRDASPKTRSVAVRPSSHIPGREAWQGLTSLVTTKPLPGSGRWASKLIEQIGSLQVDGHIETDFPLQVLTLGVLYGNMAAVIEDVVADTLPLPVVALRESAIRHLVLDMAEQAEELRKAADGLANDLRLASGGDRLVWDKGDHLGARVIFELSSVVRSILLAVQHHPEHVDAALVAWSRAARKVARGAEQAMFETACPSSFLGREVKDKTTGKDYFYRGAGASARFRRKVHDILGLEEESAPLLLDDMDRGHDAA